MANSIKTIAETRVKALVWWNKQSSSKKLNFWREFQKITFTPSFSPDELTGREIEQIWLSEIKNEPKQER
jgi:hypothetical protein